MTPGTAKESFGTTSFRYDRMVDWGRRLAVEAPFFRRLFAGVRANRVLDVACGSGRHAAMFNEWGLSVRGTDASASMIDFCRREHGERHTLQWEVRPFQEPLDDGHVFDAAVCVGNSLALAPDSDAVRQALEAMVASLRPGGLCVIGVMNLRRFQRGVTVWRKRKHVELNGFPLTVIKGVRRNGDAAIIKLVKFSPALGHIGRSAQSYEFLDLRPAQLQQMLGAAGMKKINFFGDFAWSPFDPLRSRDLITVATC